MIAIGISREIQSAIPDLTIGVVEAGDIRVTAHDPNLWAEIDARLAEITRTLQVEQIAPLPQIAGLRRAYRALGKDPTRYRGSQEALLRRVLKGKGLYSVNTVVDINNLLSIESCHSICTFDAAKIDGPVVIRAGAPGETYYGIGRDLLNIEGIPVLCDRQGPFGSPTSDSERTKVTLETSSTLTVILSFIGPGALDERCRRMADLLCCYTGARPDEMQTAIVTAAG